MTVSNGFLRRVEIRYIGGPNISAKAVVSGYNLKRMLSLDKLDLVRLEVEDGWKRGTD